MSSLRQIEANRRNAQKSTGPTSVTGKASSSMNALNMVFSVWNGFAEGCINGNPSKHRNDCRFPPWVVSALAGVPSDLQYLDLVWLAVFVVVSVRTSFTLHRYKS